MLICRSGSDSDCIDIYGGRLSEDIFSTSDLTSMNPAYPKKFRAFYNVAYLKASLYFYIQMIS